jgi:hypothetical protein
MKKKLASKKTASLPKKSSPVRKLTKRPTSEDKYVVLVRTWVFMVLFALMLGVGVIVGNYINNELNGGSPTVAGYSTDK